MDIELRYVDNINLLGIAIIQSLIIEPNHPKDRIDNEEIDNGEDEEDRDDNKSLITNIWLRINNNIIENSIEEINKWCW